MRGAVQRLAPPAAVLAIVMQLAGCASTPDQGGSGKASETKRSEIYLDLGVAYLRQGDNRKALRKLQKAESLNGHDARIHNALALTYQQLGFDDKAEAAFEEALDLDSDDPQVRNNFGVFLAKIGAYERARTQFEKALANPLYSTPEKAYYNLGWLARQEDKAEEAEGMLRTALRLRPGYPAPRLALVRLLREQGRGDDARRELAALLNRSPDHVQGHLLAGELSLERGNHKSARRHLKRVVDLAPDSREAGRSRRLLQRLRDAGGG